MDERRYEHLVRMYHTPGGIEWHSLDPDYDDWLGIHDGYYDALAWVILTIRRRERRLDRYCSAEEQMFWDAP